MSEHREPQDQKPPEEPRREVGPEDEERKSPDGPGSQITPDVEPSGS